MSFSVNTNSNALAALETLNLTQQALTQTQKQVSTGLRVSSAADDASTFAIAQGQRGDIAGFQSIANSLSLGTATLNVALQGAQTISNTLNQIKGKIVAAQDPTQDHNAIQNDITAFINQIELGGPGRAVQRREPDQLRLDQRERALVPQSYGQHRHGGVDHRQRAASRQRLAPHRRHQRRQCGRRAADHRQHELHRS